MKTKTKRRRKYEAMRNLREKGPALGYAAHAGSARVSAVPGLRNLPGQRGPKEQAGRRPEIAPFAGPWIHVWLKDNPHDDVEHYVVHEQTGRLLSVCGQRLLKSLAVRPRHGARRCENCLARIALSGNR